MFTINESEVLNSLVKIKNENQQELISKDIYTAEELFNLNITEVPFLWQNIIPQTGLCCLTGSSDCNKSTLLRQLALEIALESDECLGFKLNAKHNRVIYISTEDDASSIGAFLRKQYDSELPLDALKNIRFLFNIEDHLKKLDDMLKEQKADLVAIDAWTDLFDGDINQSPKVRASLEKYKKLSLKYGCAFIFIHHQGKSSEGNAPSKNHLLGSQGIEAKVRTVVELRRDSGNRRLMTIVKGNYTSDSIKGKSFVLELMEEFMVLQRKDETLNLNAQYGFKGIKVKYDKEAIMKVALPLKTEGLSYEKILQRLVDEFGESAPGITTLKTWLKDQPVSQFPSK